MNLLIAKFPDDIHRSAKVRAAELGITLGKFVERCVYEALVEQKKAVAEEIPEKAVKV